MPAPGALGMERMNSSAFERRDRVLDKAAFVQCVGMQHDLDVMVVGDGEAAIDGGRGRSPILVQLERARSGKNLLH